MAQLNTDETSLLHRCEDRLINKTMTRENFKVVLAISANGDMETVMRKWLVLANRENYQLVFKELFFQVPADERLPWLLWLFDETNFNIRSRLVYMATLIMRLSGVQYEGFDHVHKPEHMLPLIIATMRGLPDAKQYSGTNILTYMGRKYLEAGGYLNQNYRGITMMGQAIRTLDERDVADLAKFMCWLLLNDADPTVPTRLCDCVDCQETIVPIDQPSYRISLYVMDSMITLTQASMSRTQEPIAVSI